MKNVEIISCYEEVQFISLFILNSIKFKFFTIIFANFFLKFAPRLCILCFNFRKIYREHFLAFSLSHLTNLMFRQKKALEGKLCHCHNDKFYGFAARKNL